MNEFRYDPTNHEYWLNGNLLIHTTKILEMVGVVDKKFFTEQACIRGSAVHACCHYLAEGDLDWNTVDPAIVGYVKAYERFLQDTKFSPETCEKPIYHPTYLYGTTPDQIGKINKLTIVELKTGHMLPWTALQLALQSMAAWPKDYYAKDRLGVELHQDGTYKTQEFKDPNDFHIATAMIAVAQWNRNNK